MSRSCLSLGLVFLITAVGCSGDGEPPSDDPGDSGDTGSTVIDADNDGVAASDDCDDDDASLGAVTEDGDCDGTLTDDDCDDGDPASSTTAEDGDCDGTLTADDCDDGDANSATRAEDGDCDGTPTDDDCDDDDPDSTIKANDGDCDGTPKDEDCNDGDELLNGDDGDEDGYSTCDGDCDDDDARRNPGGTDGLLRDGDCNDSFAGPSLAHADISFVGEKANDYAGHSLSSAGDVDGDGLDDVLVGTYYYDGGSGMAYLLLGSSLVSGSNVFGSEIDLSLADYRFVGDGDLAGYSVAGAGDVDGDGLDDILVGAPTNDEGAYNAGAAYLILGSSLGTNPEIDLTVADYRFWGEYTQDRAGYSVSSAGDVDNDGLADILIGAPGMAPDADDWAGRAYIILGASLGIEAEIDLSLADHRLIGEHSQDYTGGAVSSAGDVDNDGYDDILVGAPYYDGGQDGPVYGRAYLVLGASLSGEAEILLADADHLFLAEGNDVVGLAVAGVGDVDSDGLDDLLVGAPYNDDGGSSGTTDAGKSYLILGSSLGGDAEFDLADADYSLLGTSFSISGDAVAGADVDADGRADLLVGAPRTGSGNDKRKGATYLVLGASLGSTTEIDLTDADYHFTGEVKSDYSGRAVSSAGDVDGDGRDDILVGAIGDTSGKAYLIFSGL